MLPNEVAQWTLMTLREKLVKIGARIVRYGRYVVFQLAEVAVPRALFAGDVAPDRASARVARAGGGLTRANREAAGAERRTMRRRLVGPAGRPQVDPRSGFPPSTPASLSLTNDFSRSAVEPGRETIWVMSAHLHGKVQ